MEHLQVHRGVEATPGLDMQARMKCVVGRVATVAEDWDINLTPI